jgi:Cd2+/Zn2+-exporting ATPase
MSTVNKLRLDLPLVLPNVEAGDQCVTRLIDAISGRTGIDQAHVVVADDSEPQLCVHYQPELISLGRVRELIQSAGAQITARYAHLVFRDNAALHARSARRIADGLRKVPGVLEAELAVSGALRVEYDRSAITDQALLQAATALGLKGHRPSRWPGSAKWLASQPVERRNLGVSTTSTTTTTMDMTTVRSTRPRSPPKLRVTMPATAMAGPITTRIMATTPAMITPTAASLAKSPS